MIDGAGDPNTSAGYVDAVEALYPIACGLRAQVKAATGDAYVVMSLEGLWWAEDMSEFDPTDKSNWLWTMMIGLPDAVNEATPDPRKVVAERLRTITRPRCDVSELQVVPAAMSGCLTINATLKSADPSVFVLVQSTSFPNPLLAQDFEIIESLRFD